MGKLAFVLILLHMGIQSGMSYPNIQKSEPNYLHPKMDNFKYPMIKRQLLLSYFTVSFMRDVNIFISLKHNC